MKEYTVKIAPSILSADFSIMGAEVKNLEDNGADIVHVDVMDGVFVKNITFGMKMVKDIRKVTTLPLDVHLMIVEPWNYVEKFAEAGADITAVDALSLAEEAGTAKASNVVLMGVLSAKTDFPEELWQNALEQCVPPKFLELNKKAFELGRNAAKK